MTAAWRDGWTFYAKIVLLLYASGLSYADDRTIAPWLILAGLVYLSATIAAGLSRGGLRLLLTSFTAVLIFASHAYIHPLLILLLPVTLVEASALLFRRHGFAWVLLLPALYLVPFDALADYLLIGAVSYGYFTILHRGTDKLLAAQEELDRMRGELGRMKERLSESREAIRQTEYTTKLEERSRLSQEIHDSVGHAMTGALIQMEAAKRLLGSDRDKAAELLQNAIHIAKDGIETIRRTLKAMKPLSEQLGVHRLKRTIDEFAARHALRIVFTHEGNLDLIAPLHWKIIRENALEALTNTMKYADATLVSIHIQVLNTMIKAVVSDNGKGAARVIKGLGLIGMEERAALADGTVIVDGSRGFSVTTLIPLKPTHEHSAGET
jgi:hypothetical protein